MTQVQVFFIQYIIDNMIRGLIQFFWKTFVDLFKIYGLILIYPFNLLKEMYLKNNAYLKAKLYITRWGLLPIFNVIFGFLYHFVVKPIRRYFIYIIVPHLYNDNSFYEELEKADSQLLENPKNHYKYLLFNSNNNLKFPDTEINYDDFFNYLAYFRKIVEPGWRQHYIHFYHSDFTHYRPKMYEDAMRLYRRKAVEAKHLESLEICMKNLLLLYRYLFSQLVDNSYEAACYIRYYFKKHYPSSQRFISYLPRYNHIYSFLNFMLCFNFSWFLVLGDRMNKLYLEIQSLGEVGTERSIYYSKKFGFAGNLYLQFGYFLKEWNMYLEKSMDSSSERIYREYKHDEPYEFMHESLGRRNLQHFFRKKTVHGAKIYRPYKATVPKVLDNSMGYEKLSAIFARRRRRYDHDMYTYRYNLNHKPVSLIRKDLLVHYQKQYTFYKKLYSIFGGYTKYIKQFVALFKIRPISKANFKSERTSFLSSYYNETNNMMLLFLFIITLESTLFVLHVLNH